ncbi:MAG: FAD-dependent oxidoreductase, partial [Propionibacteriales bacterium]|nr:FAD-dependent oxidoreductase [Propionibacteriales bacterium]
MARVVVVGGGLAGMAAAARLAKQRHDVTLCERGATLGGALRPVESDGFRWDGGAATTTLPAVLRDLFRKTGRPLERELDLLPVTSPRRHRFDDGSEVDLPTDRAGQDAALTGLVGARAAESWTAHLDGLDDVWAVLRRRALETAFAGCDSLEPGERSQLDQRTSLRKRARRTFKDERLRALLEQPTVL